MRLGRKERIKYVARVLWINSRSGVLYLNADCVARIFGSDSQYAMVIIDRIHRIDRVLHQVDDYLLQLTAVTHYRRQLGCQLNASGNLMTFQFAVQSTRCLGSQIIHIDQIMCALSRSKQLTNIIEYLTGAMGRSNYLLRY